jgi:purine nucleoside permease
MISRFIVLAAALIAALSRPVAADEPPVAPKVLIITMFGGEAKPWLDGEALTRKFAPPGLFRANPDIACSDRGLCLITTGMGYGARLRRQVRPDEDLLSRRRHRRRRSHRWHGRLRPLGALRRRRRTAE